MYSRSGSEHSRSYNNNPKKDPPTLIISDILKKLSTARNRTDLQKAAEKVGSADNVLRFVQHNLKMQRRIVTYEKAESSSDWSERQAMMD